MEWLILALALATFAYAVFLYNRLVSLRNGVRNALAQIDVQLQRRFDLIPNLVETAKAYLNHERNTLEAVIAARNGAVAAAARVRAGEGGALAEVARADGLLSGALNRLFALVESYPELKANQNLALLHEELTSTENRVAFARQAYNDAVMHYNIQREQFPDLLLARLFRFEPAEQWLAADEEVQTPPAVRLT